MIVTLKDILRIAEAKKMAIGSFNTLDLNGCKAVLGAAEELDMPVIIMHAQVHEEMGLCNMDEIAPVMLFMADRASVPVCVHLDHGTDLNYIKRGLDLGFTSVMYDGSGEEHCLNRANTQLIVNLARSYGASVEAEVGSMGTGESGEGDGESIYTDPCLAKDFVEETGIDALACAFGTVHGIYTKEPKLDFDRVREINSKIDVPIVMHGGSGVSEADYHRVIDCGVRKINYYTYMSKAGGEAVAAMKDMTFYHDIAVTAQNAMRENVKSAMKVFGNLR